MKTALLALSLAVTHLAAFAQGRVTTGNDANHLVVFSTNAASLPTRYAPYAGQPAPYDQLQGFTVDLLAGLSPTELTLQHVAAPAGHGTQIPGRFISYCCHTDQHSWRNYCILSTPGLGDSRRKLCKLRRAGPDASLSGDGGQLCL